MSFWSSERIKAEQAKHPLISNFREYDVKYASYELRLSREVLSSPDVKSGFEDQIALKILPGQFAFLCTEEQVTIPTNAIAFISIKASVKFKGLVNVSGFHVDPGFSGRLKFSVYNASGFDIHLKYGEPCFIIWFADLDAPTHDSYKGIHQSQSGISDGDRDWLMRGPNLSPAELSRKFNELADQFDFLKKVGGTILATVLVPIFVGIILMLIQYFVDLTKPNEKPEQLQINANGIPATITAGTNQTQVLQLHVNVGLSKTNASN